MLDHYIWGDASRISPEAPVPVVDVTKDSFAAGGAANVALNIASLGGSAVLAGWTGKDEAGVKLSEILTAAKVERCNGFVSENLPTIRKTRVMVRNQQLCRIDREADAESYRLDGKEALDTIQSAVSDCAAVLLSDYGKGAVRDGIVEAVLRKAEQQGVPVALDPKPRRRLRFSGIDVITPNRTEALELAGFSSQHRGAFPYEEVCAQIWENYQPGSLVITLGAEGILLSTEGRVDQIIPTYARQVFDVSGAGDTVIASLLLALSAGADLVTAARLANLAAGVVVAKVGTATVNSEEILDFLSRHPDRDFVQGAESSL